VLEIFSKLQQWPKEQGACVFLWDLVMVRRRKKDCSFFLVRFNDGQKKRKRVYMCFFCGIWACPKLKDACELL
jgi:hypothetical protein